METSELCNLLALGGLLLCKLVLLGLVIYYCCRAQRNSMAQESNANRSVADTANQTDDSTIKKKSGGDIPPTYSSIMLKIDPPDYIDSVLQDINPIHNHSWAIDIEKGDVKPEILDVINRSRHNSLCPASDELDVAEVFDETESTGRASRRTSLAARSFTAETFWIGI